MSRLAQAFDPAAPQRGGFSTGRVQQSLEDLVDAFKVKVTTEGVAQLLQAGAAPQKSETGGVAQLVDTALKLDERQSAKEQAAREEADRLREQNDQMRAALYDRKREEAREKREEGMTMMDAFSRMAAAQVEAAERQMKFMLDLAEQRNRAPEPDPITKQWADYGMRMAMQQPPNPLEYTASILDAAKKLGLVGQNQGPAAIIQGGPFNGMPVTPETIPMMQWMGEFGLKSRELDLRQKEIETTASNQTEQKNAVVNAFTEIAKTVAARPDFQVLRGGQAPRPMAPPMLKLPCASCGRPHAIPDTDPGFACQGCGVWNDVIRPGEEPPAPAPASAPPPAPAPAPPGPVYSPGGEVALAMAEDDLGL